MDASFVSSDAAGEVSRLNAPGAFRGVETTADAGMFVASKGPVAGVGGKQIRGVPSLGRTPDACEDELVLPLGPPLRWHTRRVDGAVLTVSKAPTWAILAEMLGQKNGTTTVTPKRLNRNLLTPKGLS